MKFDILPLKAYDIWHSYPYIYSHLWQNGVSRILGWSQGAISTRPELLRRYKPGWEICAVAIRNRNPGLRRYCRMLDVWHIIWQGGAGLQCLPDCKIWLSWSKLAIYIFLYHILIYPGTWISCKVVGRFEGSLVGCVKADRVRRTFIHEAEV